MPPDEITTFYDRFVAIRGWIERRTDQPGTVQTRQLVPRGRGGAGARARALPGSGRPAPARVTPRARTARQLALNLGGTAR